MWEANHKPECSDQDRYEVVRSKITVELQDGEVLETSQEEVSARCYTCGAPAYET